MAAAYPASSHNTCADSILAASYSGAEAVTQLIKHTYVRLSSCATQSGVKIRTASFTRDQDSVHLTIWALPEIGDVSGFSKKGLTSLPRVIYKRHVTAPLPNEKQIYFSVGLFLFRGS